MDPIRQHDPHREQPFFPGDEAIERRIRRVHPVERGGDGRTSEQASPTASAVTCRRSRQLRIALRRRVQSLLQGKGRRTPGDHIYFQGHAAPGIYARAYLEGRLSEEHLDNFRQEIGGAGLVELSTPRLMPEFWEFPTVSMGLGPINCHLPRPVQPLPDTTAHRRHHRSKRLVFLGDGETDEPETLGAISLAAANRTRQPDLRRQLQPATARRARAR